MFIADLRERGKTHRTVSRAISCCMFVIGTLKNIQLAILNSELVVFFLFHQCV